MAHEDIKNLIHHLNDMYKALGVLQSSLADIDEYISKDAHHTISKGISDINKTIEVVGSEAYLTYQKRLL